MLIPFKDGEMCHSVMYHQKDEIEMQDREEFESEMQYVSYAMGRSSFTVYLIGTDGYLYNMIGTEFMDKVAPFMDMTRVYGVWNFKKRGEYYNMTLVRLTNPPT